MQSHESLRGHDKVRNHTILEQRKPSIPPPLLPKREAHSFMKETSSSKKKQIPTTRGSGNTSVLLQNAPSAPLPNTPSSTKKRLEYSRQLSQTLRSKRLVASGSSKNLPDITNVDYPNERASIPRANSENVFDRLYQDDLEHRMKQQQKNRQQIHQQSEKYSSKRNAQSLEKLRSLERIPSGLERRTISGLTLARRLYSGSERSHEQATQEQSIQEQRTQERRNLSEQNQRSLEQRKLHNLEQRNPHENISLTKQSRNLSERRSQNAVIEKPRDHVEERLARHSNTTPTPAPRIRKPNSPLKDFKIDTIKNLYQILNHREPNLFVSDEDDTKTKPSFRPDEIPNMQLNIYEKGEVVRKKDLYYVPKSSRFIDVKNYKNNFGFDDPLGNYKIIPNDHINYRYEILQVLGSGSFGNVIKAKDHKFLSQKLVAVKVINLDWSLQSINEIKMLKLLNEKEGEGKQYILKYYEHFNFRSHMCITTELLSINIYTIIEHTNFKGFSLGLIKDFSAQMLGGLQYIHSYKIIHCDIKPENIMLQLPLNPNNISLQVKIIDFGSSCFVNETAYTYIQSRYYRAPEVLLGAVYAEKIDIWSIGCVIAEMFLGSPLLAGRNEVEQIGLMIELFGAPKSSSIVKQRDFLARSTNKRDITEQALAQKNIKKTFLFKLFDLHGKINMTTLNYYHNNTGASSTSVPSSKKQFKLNSKNLELHLNLNKINTEMSRSFLQFLNRIFVWDPSERSSVVQLLGDPFIQM